jgi:proteasome lid subunit RPN8/RPN11
MKATDNTDNIETAVAAPKVEFSSEVLRQIRQHARSSMSAEICGVLLGTSADGATNVIARIEGVGAVEAGTNVTFTQETWEHIFRVKDAQYPDLSIVGWYHSHPGFGVFLSEYDIFIHENFFSGSHQIAWVFDPHSDEEGCFGWVGKSVKPLAGISTRQKLRGQTDDATAALETSILVENGREKAVAQTLGRLSRATALFSLALAVASLAAGALLRPSFDEHAPRARNWIRSLFSPPAVSPPPVRPGPPHALSAPVPPDALPPPAAPSPEMRGRLSAPGGESPAPSPAPTAGRRQSNKHEQPKR